MSGNTFQLALRVVAVEPSTSASGQPFTIVRGQIRSRHADEVSVVSYGDLAIASAHLAPGDCVTVHGHVQSYRDSLELVADDLGRSMRRLPA